MHHHAAFGEVVAPGFVVLQRRDDRRSAALDGRRRVGDDDVEPLVAQFEVVAAVGDHDAPVRVGEDRLGVVVVEAEHVGHGRHELDHVRPQAADERGPERGPHAEGDDERSFASGRAMSGRIGISFASTVSRVIDVPATHSSGVALTWPACTDAISSSVESKIVPPADSIHASLGCATAPGRVTRTPTRATATSPATHRPDPARPGDERQPDRHRAG